MAHMFLLLLHTCHETDIVYFVCQVSFQFVFTTVFGWYSTYIFLCTGHLVGPVAVHIFCNWMGFPAIGDALQHPQKRAVLATYVLGVLAFATSLWHWPVPAAYSGRFKDLIDD